MGFRVYGVLGLGVYKDNGHGKETRNYYLGFGFRDMNGLGKCLWPIGGQYNFRLWAHYIL